MTKQKITGKVLQTYQIDIPEDKAVLLCNNLNVLLKLIEDPDCKFKDNGLYTYFSDGIFDETRDVLASLLRR